MMTFISLTADVTAYSTRILSAYLKSKGFNTRIIFLPDIKFESDESPFDGIPYDKNTMDQVTDLCKDSSLIGISLFTSDFPNAVYVTGQLKGRKTSVC